MDENLVCTDSDACLHYINVKYESYNKILDNDQKNCLNLLAFIREQTYLLNNNDDDAILQSTIGCDKIQLINQLDYFEQESLKIYEDNKKCLFQMFENLFDLHKNCNFNQVIIDERKINKKFQYRPTLLKTIEKINLPKYFKTRNTRDNSSTSTKLSLQMSNFSNRIEIEEFQRKKELNQINRSPIESNEIDLLKLVRETDANNPSNQFMFSKISLSMQNQKPNIKSFKTFSQSTVPCHNALLISANKRFVMIYNMNIENTLYIFDTQKDETKPFQWDEGEILSVGHVENNVFFIITSTKLFLYDIIKENITKQYFLYDTLYKNLLLIMDNLSYKTVLKRNNQVQSVSYDNYCYYLYTNKEYNQILIKCTLDNFQEQLYLNLTEHFRDIQEFIGFTVTTNSLLTFLIIESNLFQLLFCDELHKYNIMKKIPINNSIDSRKIVSTYISNIKNVSLNKHNNQTIKYGKQLWFILDIESNCIHCLSYDNYLTKIESLYEDQIQSISIFDDKLILAYNELSVEIINLDHYFSSLQL